MTKRAFLATLTALIAISSSVGCGPKEGMAIVTGSVTVDGAPAKSGHINFIPFGGAANPVGARIEDGRYEIEAPIGESRVEVRVPEVVGKKKLYNTPDSPVKEIRQESLPDKFNNKSTLRMDVKAGSNERDFELSTTA